MTTNQTGSEFENYHRPFDKLRRIEAVDNDRSISKRLPLLFLHIFQKDTSIQKYIYYIHLQLTLIYYCRFDSFFNFFYRFTTLPYNFKYPAHLLSPSVISTFVTGIYYFFKAWNQRPVFIFNFYGSEQTQWHIKDTTSVRSTPDMLSCSFCCFPKKRITEMTKKILQKINCPILGPWHFLMSHAPALKFQLLLNDRLYKIFFVKDISYLKCHSETFRKSKYT